jgi:hypothetical protein
MFLTLLQNSGAPPTPVVVWIKVAGTWKQATMFVKVSGTWKTTTPKLNVSGIWK